jgi:hypothetical protein
MMPRRAVFPRIGWVLAAFAALISVSVVHALHAATFPDLFTVTVVPTPGTADQRPEVERLGMVQLLTRVTGRRDAATFPELAELLARSSSYVNSYGALDRERIQVGFRDTIVNDLTQLNWPIWGAERPLTLIWLAVDFGDGQRALMPETPNSAEWSPEFAQFMLDLREQLDTVARERGLPVKYPLLDPQDLATVSFTEIWGGFDGLIEAASERYAADTELIGRISVTPFGVDVRWSLLEEGRGRAIFGTDVGGGLEWLADQYAAEFSVAGGARSSRISVLGVASLDEYGRIMSYLESLSVLQPVDVEGLDGSTLNLRITARGDERVVERLLTLGGILVPSSDLRGTPAPAGSLVFRIAGPHAE